MTDFRVDFYRRYVSLFKGDSSRLGEAQLRRRFSWFDHKYGPLLAGVAPDARVLELGCGPGDLLAWLRERGFSAAEGVDLSLEQVEIARARGLAARVADVFEALDDESAFAAIVAIDFFEHFTREELLRLGDAIHRALAPEGRLLLQTPNGEGLLPRQIIHGDLTHMTILSPGSLEQWLRLTGFDRFEFREAGPAPIGLRGRLRLAAWRVIATGANLVRRIETGKRQQVWTENVICCCRRAPRTMQTG